MYPRLAWFQMNRFTLHYQWSPYPWPEASSICIIVITIVITEFTQHIRTYDFQTRTHSVLGFELSVWISWQSRTSSPLAFSSTLWDSGDVGDQTLYFVYALGSLSWWAKAACVGDDGSRTNIPSISGIPCNRISSRVSIGYMAPWHLFRKE